MTPGARRLSASGETAPAHDGAAGAVRTRGARAPSASERAAGAPAAGVRARVAPRAWAATAAVALAALAIFLAFVGYGFNLDDEGNVLYQILRTYRGERPYLDFHTGYTPAMFYLNAALFRLFGVSVIPVRVGLALVNALATALTFRLALRVARPAEAACAALAYALCMPFFAGQFASFNIPYPAWYAVAAWLGAELASVRAAESGRRSPLLAAGVLAGVAFSFKPNTGILCLGAAVLAQLLAAPRARGRFAAALEVAVLALACAAVAAVLAFEVFSVKFALLAAPAIALFLGGIAVRIRRAGGARAGGDAPDAAALAAERGLPAAIADACALAAGFLAVNVAWLLFFVPRMGAAGFARDVLLLGAGVERIYGLHYPEPSLWSLLAVALLIAVAVLPWAIERGWVGRRALAALAAASLVALAAAAAASAVAPEGLVVSTAMQIENLTFFVLPLVLAAAVARWLAGARSPAWTVALVYALLLFVQLYPRIDFMHVVISMPSALVVAAGCLCAVERRWATALARVRGDGRSEPSARAVRRALAGVRAAALAAIALALVARAAPLLDARVRLLPDAALRRMTPLGSPAMPVALERDRDHDLRELRRVAAFVARETAPGDALLVFPALAIVPFVTGRHTPFPHDYFFPGRPSHADEAAMIDTIAAAPPPLAVTMNDRLGYFSASPAYYFLLRDFVQRNYRLVRRFGRFDVLLRRDLMDARPHLVPPRSSGGPLSTAFAQGEYRDEVRRARSLARSGRPEDLADSADELADVDRQVRRARLLAIAAVAARAPRGLASVEPIVAPDRKSKLLLLRALGEFGDAGALPYLRAVYAATVKSEPRVAREATTAINYVLARELASRYAWTDAAPGTLWDVPASLLGSDVASELGDFDLRQRIGALTALAAAAAGRDDLAPALTPVQDPSDTSWWRVTSAYALTRLGHGDATSALVAAMRDGTFAEQYVPSLLLDRALFDQRRTAALVSDLLRSGSPAERETAAWMAALATSAIDEGALAAAARDPDPGVRNAARWARAARGREGQRRGASGGES
ncbi:MAG TPA: glycosyltransferase family 39 protein [Candidatus Binatia bacterium]|nr:glycosyltransferase family 39 protein [Candidatus Binatia bacterium]